MYDKQLFKIILIFSLAFSETSYSDPAQQTHGNLTPSTPALKSGISSSREQGSETTPNPEEVARKKLLNDAADADPNLSDGRRVLQTATESFWGSLTKEQQTDITTELASGKNEKLDAILKEQGLVLSSADKREKFLKNLGVQLSANTKRETSTGISDLILWARREPKGGPKKRQEQLAAKAVLQSEIEKNRTAVDYLKKNLGWTDEDSLLTINRVEEQSKLLASGTPRQKVSAQNYLYRIFGPIYGVGMRNADKPSNAITELFSNPTLRESPFGKIGRPFITAGMGQNFTSKDNPYGACAGVECARDFIADTLTRSAMKGHAESPNQAVQQFEKEKTLPITLKTGSGSVVPTMSDEGIKALADIYTNYDNGWLAEEKDKVRVAAGLKNLYEVDRSVSFKNQQDLNTFFDLPEVQEANGAIIWVSKKTMIPQPGGTTKEVVSGHVVSLSPIGSGASQTYLVRDPNIKGLSFDAKIDPITGKFSYSYSSEAGKTVEFEWDNFFPSPHFWKTVSK